MKGELQKDKEICIIQKDLTINVYVIIYRIIVKLSDHYMFYSTVVNAQYISNIYYCLSKQHDCFIVQLNLSDRKNSLIDSADSAKGCTHFCSEMVPFNGAYSANTSAPWYHSVPPARLSVCFYTSHQFCLSPLCCVL